MDMETSKKISLALGAAALILAMVIFVPKIFNGKNQTGNALDSQGTQAAKCIVAGCNGELCVAAGSQNTASSCIWNASYACYKGATCALQASGDCGWTQTPTLAACLQKNISALPDK